VKRAGFNEMNDTNANRIPSGKSGPVARNVDDYLASIPQPARSTLSRLRMAIVSVLPPGAIETISYRIPAYKYKGWLCGIHDTLHVCDDEPADH
jgi:hypothetical protein